MSSSDAGAASAAPALAELAERIRAEVDAAEQGHRSALAHAIRAGELLAEAKASPHMRHGEWLPWLEANFPGDRSTAANYIRLADPANVERVLHLSSVREALAAIKQPPAKPAKPRGRAPDAGGHLWENDDVIAWIAKRSKAGDDRHRAKAASLDNKYDWPLPGQHVTQATWDRGTAIIADRQRRGDTNRPRRSPKESGKRLRTLHAEKRDGQRTETDLWHLQIAVAKAVAVLEGFDLPDLDWSDSVEMYVVQIYDDLARHMQWTETAIDVTTAHMGELGRRRKIQALDARAADPSSTPNERATAARLAERLKSRSSAARLEEGA